MERLCGGVQRLGEATAARWDSTGKSLTSSLYERTSHCEKSACRKKPAYLEKPAHLEKPAYRNKPARREGYEHISPDI